MKTVSFLKSSLFIVFITLFGITGRAQLEVPPSIQWKTLTTKHFEIIFDVQQQELAQHYALSLEKAYFLLSQHFKSFPKNKVVVVINDKIDISNGYATPIPYPHIMAYPVLPTSDGSLADYGDWAFDLLAHEFTHILTFEPTRGIIKPLKSIFGNIISPNSLMPQWWKEGVAVEMETRLSQHGRLRSTYQDASLRALTLDGTLYSYDIAQANEYIYTWPQGSRPYLFGSLFWSQMLHDHGTLTAANLHEAQAGRVPYFIEEPARKHIGQNYTDAYNKALSETFNLASKQLETLKNTPSSDFKIRTDNYLTIASPTISPDGQHLAFVSEDDGHARSVQILTKTAKVDNFLNLKPEDTIEYFKETFTPNEILDGPPSGSIQRVSWFPDSSTIIYDKVGYTNRIQRFSDLYTYNLKNRKTFRLTNALRAREPAVSPSGKRVAFVKLEGGRTHLGLIELEGRKENSKENSKDHQILWSPEFQHRISYPHFWSENEVIYSQRTPAGKESLYIFDLTSKTPRELFPDFPNSRFSFKHEQKLYFVSSKNGVMNLYVTDSELLQAQPLSNSLTGVFTSTIDPINKRIYSALMTSKGMKLAALDLQAQLPTSTVLPTVTPIFSERYTQTDLAVPTSELLLENSKITDYSPSRYLLPGYWIPFLSASSSDTGLTFQAMTTGFDPLKKHSYSLIGEWETAINKGSFIGSYVNQTTALPITLTAYDRNYFLGSNAFIINESGGQIAALPDTKFFSIYDSLSLGAIYQERSLGNSQRKRMGVYGFFSFANYSKAGAQVSPEGGFSTYLGAYHYVAKEGYYNHNQFLLGANKYFRGFGKHHAINLRMDASHIPERAVPSFYGSSTESMHLAENVAGPEYILRGYKKGQILGKNLATVNLEYRFPLRDIYKGSGTDPLFLRRLYGAFVADGAAADGIYFNTSEAATVATKTISLDRDHFWSVGAEIKFETTIGYIAPVTLVLGYYYAFNAEEDSRGTIASALQISGF